jgi:hypothetical protein
MRLRVNPFLCVAVTGFLSLITLGLGFPLANPARMALLVFGVLGFAAAYKNFDFFIAALLVFFPIAGFVSNLFILKAVSLLMPFVMFGAFGRSVALMFQKTDRIELNLPKEVWFYMASVLLSVLVAVAYFAQFLPDLSYVVSSVPWGEVKLLNAFGWVALALINFSLGLTVFLFLYPRIEGRVFFYLRCVMAGYLASGLIGFLQFHSLLNFGNSLSFQYADLARYNAGSTDPNAVGILSAVFFFIWVGSVLTHKHQKALWYLFPIFPFLIIISGSRTPFIVLTVGFCVLFWAYNLKRRGVWVVLGLLIASLAGMVYWAKTQKAHQRSYEFFKAIKEIPEQSVAPNAVVVAPVEAAPGWRETAATPLPPKTDSKILNLAYNLKYAVQTRFLNNRIPYWENAWNVFLHHPLVGCGFGSYLIQSPKYAKTLVLDLNVKSMNDNACNMYLQVAAEQGVVGLISFVALLFGALLRFLRSFRVEKHIFDASVFAAFMGVCVAFHVGSHLVSADGNVLFWMLLSILYSLPRTTANESRKGAFI